jgi:hypothetical protein
MRHSNVQFKNLICLSLLLYTITITWRRFFINEFLISSELFNNFPVLYNQKI